MRWVILLSMASAALSHAQAPARPTFDAASIKVFDGLGMRVEESPGEVHYVTSINYLLMRAYGLFNAQIEGPAWLDTNRYDIRATIPAALSKDRLHQVPLMLRALLLERFGLTYHFTKRRVEVYELTVADQGMKIQAAAADSGRDEGCVSAPVERMNGAECHVRMADLARLLGEKFMVEGIPVLDRTGLTGVYDFKFQWAPPVLLRMGVADGVSIGDALQRQLGLKLKAAKDEVEVMVVDHIANTPTAN